MLHSRCIIGVDIQRPITLICSRPGHSSTQAQSATSMHGSAIKSAIAPPRAQWGYYSFPALLAAPSLMAAKAATHLGSVSLAPSAKFPEHQRSRQRRLGIDRCVGGLSSRARWAPALMAITLPVVALASGYAEADRSSVDPQQDVDAALKVVPDNSIIFTYDNGTRHQFWYRLMPGDVGSRRNVWAAKGVNPRDPSDRVGQILQYCANSSGLWIWSDQEKAAGPGVPPDLKTYVFGSTYVKQCGYRACGSRATAVSSLASAAPPNRGRLAGRPRSHLGHARGDPRSLRDHSSTFQPPERRSLRRSLAPWKQGLGVQVRLVPR